MEESNNNFVVVDEDSTLKLYSYQSCTNDDEADIKKYRGVIKYFDDNIVALSLPYTDEYVYDEGNMDDIPLESIEKYKIHKSIEGTVIRVFWYQDKWYITTNRKLDAFKSFWSSHLSFGQLFVNQIFSIFHENTIESFLGRLDQENIYYFLLLPTIENRIVCKVDHTKPSLYFIGFLSKNNIDGSLSFEHKSLEQIPKMEELTFENKEEVFNYVRDVDIWESQGVILFNREQNKQIKILNQQYKYYWSIRNNNPNLYLRYLEIRSDTKKLDDFFKLYPKFIQIADRIESHIFEISKYIHEAYLQRYIQKNYLSLPKQEYMILKKAHEWHNLDKTHNRIYRMKILQLLNEEEALYLYQMIRRHYKY